MIPGAPPSLRSRALRYLAAREYSRAELAARLARVCEGQDEATPQDIERVLDELAAQGYIDEARVAESVLHRRAGRLGAARVMQELRAKELPEGVLRDAAARLQASELERARGVWRRKFGRPPVDAAELARQLRFLVARGFSADVARRVVRSPIDPDE